MSLILKDLVVISSFVILHIIIIITIIIIVIIIIINTYSLVSELRALIDSRHAL